MSQNNDMLARQLHEALEDLGYAPRPYSGRGMFGRECIGVALPGRGAGFLGELAAAIERRRIEMNLDGLDWRPICREMATDSLGLGTIAYWPSLPWPEGARCTAD